MNVEKKIDQIRIELEKARTNLEDCDYTCRNKFTSNFEHTDFHIDNALSFLKELKEWK